MLNRIVTDLLKSDRGAELVGSTIAINVLALGSSLYSIHLLNRYVSIGLAPTLITLTVGVLLAIAVELALRKLRQRVLGELNSQRDNALSQRLFEAFAHSRFESLGETPLVARREALNAPTAAQQLTSTNNQGALLDLPFAVLFMFAAGLLYWPFGLIALVGSALAVVMGIRGEFRQRTAAELHAKANARAQQLGQFLLSAGEAIRCLPVIGPLTKRWNDVQRDSLDSRRQGMDLQSALQGSIQTVGQLINVAVYFVGAIAVVRGDLSTGALIGANILVSRCFSVVSRSAYLVDPLLRARRAEEALQQIEALDMENRDGVRPAAFKGQLELVDTAFAYPKQPIPLFERLDLKVAAGQVVVISGPNGSGKSTLIKCMLGLLAPQRGLIRADGIELRQLAQDWWRCQVGYAPQENQFFDGSLRENLVLDRPVDDAELLGLIRDMGLENYLANDPAGLDRPVHSHEAGMASGIRRRFVLIRAILGSPGVVFLDDPTEGLDEAGHAVVAKLLNRLLQQGKTLVVASNEAFIRRAADVVVDMSAKPIPLVSALARNESATTRVPPTLVSAPVEVQP
jgi:ATP-binding cassette subfamily C protein LapB